MDSNNQTSQPINNPQPIVQTPPPPVSNTGVKRSKKMMIIIGIVVFLIVAIAAGYFIMNKQFKAFKQNRDTSLGDTNEQTSSVSKFEEEVKAMPDLDVDTEFATTDADIKKL